MGNVVRACSDDDPLRVELLFKDVADCLERSAVPPETTSFGNGARASSSYAKRASQGGRSTINARTSCSSSGGKTGGN
jgi:hypothetical protein